MIVRIIAKNGYGDVLPPFGVWHTMTILFYSIKTEQTIPVGCAADGFGDICDWEAEN